jgi:hypothetical protein
MALSGSSHLPLVFCPSFRFLKAVKRMGGKTLM